MSFQEDIQKLRNEFSEKLKEAKTSKEIDDLKVRYLGKKGPVQALMVHLKNCSSEDRPAFGKKINELKNELTSSCEESLRQQNAQEQAERLKKEWIDVTLPGRQNFQGREHPITQMLDKAIDILIAMGFSVQYGPNLDTDYYNFESLNFPKDHPARDMQDTFYISTDLLLRTHTSNVQTRVMETHNPPIRVIAPGRCFRNETISSRSHVFFHQIEGFYIAEDVTFADLLSTMQEFWSKLFEKDVATRFRPSYFPFVEPGIEVDIGCTACDQKGCRLCKHTGWLEVAGAGMIHPEVLKSGGIDPEKYSGYAWGLGIERLALLELNIPDIRMFTENDTRMLAQFS